MVHLSTQKSTSSRETFQHFEEALKFFGCSKHDKFKYFVSDRGYFIVFRTFPCLSHALSHARSHARKKKTHALTIKSASQPFPYFFSSFFSLQLSSEFKSHFLSGLSTYGIRPYHTSTSIFPKVSNLPYMRPCFQLPLTLL